MKILNHTQIKEGQCTNVILGKPHLSDSSSIVARQSAGVHWYGKAESRPGRKMAHVTVTAPDFPT